MDGAPADSRRLAPSASRVASAARRHDEAERVRRSPRLSIGAGLPAIHLLHDPVALVTGLVNKGSGNFKPLVLSEFQAAVDMHKDTLFPGAKLSVVRDPDRSLSRYTHRRALLELLSDPGLPEQLSTKQIGEKLGVVWGDISGKVINEETRMMLKALGWTYVSRKGPSGSVFCRLAPAPELDCELSSASRNREKC